MTRRQVKERFCSFLWEKCLVPSLSLEKWLIVLWSSLYVLSSWGSAEFIWIFRKEKGEKKETYWGISGGANLRFSWLFKFRSAVVIRALPPGRILASIVYKHYEKVYQNILFLNVLTTLKSSSLLTLLFLVGCREAWSKEQCWFSGQYYGSKSQRLYEEFKCNSRPLHFLSTEWFIFFKSSFFILKCYEALNRQFWKTKQN